MDFKSLRNWQSAFRLFLRFLTAKIAVTYGMDIMLGLFNMCSGVVTNITSKMGDISAAAVSLPSEIQTAIEGVGFLQSIPLWLVTIIGSLVIWVLSILMIMTVYGRFFRLYLYTAIAPLPLSTFAGEGSSSTGKAFLKSYTGVCLEGAIIVICCIIFGAYVNSSTPGIANGDLPPFNLIWNYLAEAIFNMLVLVGLVKGSDRVVKEMLGL